MYVTDKWQPNSQVLNFLTVNWRQVAERAKVINSGVIVDFRKLFVGLTEDFLLGRLHL